MSDHPKGEDPRPTDDLSDVEAWPFPDGVDEIVVRVSRYDKDLTTPACIQAVVKPAKRSQIWGVGVAPNPAIALNTAIRNFYENNGKPWPSGGEHGHRREPILEPDPDIDDLLG